MRRKRGEQADIYHFTSWNRYIGIGIFVVLMMDLLLNMPNQDNLHAFNTTVYGLNYDFGMGSRLLIGSLLSVFTNYLSVKTLYWFIALSLTFLNGLVAWGCQYAIRHTKEQLQVGVIIVIIIYLSSPSAPGFLYHWENFGRLDTYLLIYLLIGVYMSNNKWTALCLPVICFVAIATHQVFLFIYFPGLISIALYRMIKEPESKVRKMTVVLTIIISFSAFHYFQSIAPGLHFESVEEVISAIKVRSDIPIDSNMLKAEYFMEMSGHWDMFVIPYWQIRVFSGIISLVLLIPVILHIALFWIKTYRSCYNKSYKKWMWWIWLSPLLSIPIFIMTIDWGRWLAGIFICQFIILIYVVVDGWKPSKSGLQSIQNFYHYHSYLLAILVFYLMSLGRFETIGTLKPVVRFVTIVWSIL